MLCITVKHVLNCCVCVSVPCPIGTYRTLSGASCEMCAVGSYQDQVGSDRCNSCPGDKSTLQEGCTTSSQCIGNNNCIKSYTEFAYIVLMERINKHYREFIHTGWTYIYITYIAMCLFELSSNPVYMCTFTAFCKPGSFSYDGFVPCMPCPKGSYSSLNRSPSCTECPGDTWTPQVGQQSSSACKGGYISLSHRPISVNIH